MIASDLNIGVVTVSVNLPYESVVNILEQKISNAKRCESYMEVSIYESVVLIRVSLVLGARNIQDCYIIVLIVCVLLKK